MTPILEQMFKDFEEIALAVANLWHNGFVDYPDDRPIWGINDHSQTVGDVRKARKLFGLPITRQ